MHVSEYIWKTFHEELGFLKYRETFENLLPTVTFLKSLPFYRYFSVMFWEQYQKTFDPFKVLPVYFNDSFCVIQIH